MKTKLTQILAQKMLEAQREMNHAVRDKKNTFLGNGYASLENVIGRAKEVYNNLDISFQQISHDNPDGATVETVFIGHGGCFSAGKVSVPVDKKDPQKFGSAVTYARRYSLVLACGIGSVDDDAETAMGRSDSGQKENKKTKTFAKKVEQEKKEYYQFKDNDDYVLFEITKPSDLVSNVRDLSKHYEKSDIRILFDKNKKIIEKAKNWKDITSTELSDISKMIEWVKGED